MSKESTFESIDVLRKRVDAHLKRVSKGEASLDEMDALLKDIRELEERVIIIRFKAIEALSVKQQEIAEARATQPEVAQETLFSEVIPEESEESPVEEKELTEFPDPNQISLIDSIEEISREVSINENMSAVSMPSLAEKMVTAGIPSVYKALSINQKMGMVQQLFQGDEPAFRAFIAELDNAENRDAALERIKKLKSEGVDEESVHLQDLIELIERRFQ